VRKTKVKAIFALLQRCSTYLKPPYYTLFLGVIISIGYKQHMTYFYKSVFVNYTYIVEIVLGMQRILPFSLLFNTLCFDFGWNRR